MGDVRGSYRGDKDYCAADAKKAPKGAFFCSGGSCGINSAFGLTLRASAGAVQNWRGNFVEPAQVLIQHDTLRYVRKAFEMITVLQMRKKRQKALFSVVVGRAGLTRPLASPFGPAQALFKIGGAILSNLHRFSSSTTLCAMLERRLR